MSYDSSCNCEICGVHVLCNDKGVIIHGDTYNDEILEHEPVVDHQIATLLRASHMFLKATKEINEVVFWDFVENHNVDWRTPAVAQTAYMVHKAQRAQYPEQYMTIWGPMRPAEIKQAFNDHFDTVVILSERDLMHLANEAYDVDSPNISQYRKTLQLVWEAQFPGTEMPVIHGYCVDNLKE